MKDKCQLTSNFNQLNKNRHELHRQAQQRQRHSCEIELHYIPKNRRQGMVRKGKGKELGTKAKNANHTGTTITLSVTIHAYLILGIIMCICIRDNSPIELIHLPVGLYCTSLRFQERGEGFEQTARINSWLTNKKKKRLKLFKISKLAFSSPPILSRRQSQNSLVKYTIQSTIHILMDA